jgi:hypothetical protein
MSEFATADQVSTQNNPARQWVNSPLETAVSHIHENWPNISPNIITAAGALSVMGVGYLAAKRPKLAPALVLPFTAFNLTDLFDGKLERHKAFLEGREPNPNGHIVDATWDKLKEFATELSLASRAKQRGDKAAAGIHLAAGVTSSWPALTKANAEAHGIVVDEGGLGTTPVRATLAGVDMVFGEKPGVSRTVGLVSLLGNVATSYKRVHALKPGSRHNIGKLGSVEKAAASGQRRSALGGVALLTGAIGTAIVVKEIKQRRAEQRRQEQEALVYTNGATSVV